MARRSFFRRISDTIRRIFQPEPPPRPVPPPSPPLPPPPGGGGGGGGRENPFREIWDYTVTERDIYDIRERTGYSENELFQFHFEILFSLDPEAEEDEQLDMWQDYLLAFVSDGMSHDTFFEIWNIDDYDFDWALWREAMGYSHRNERL